jgi:hypothetical protein
MPNLKEKEIEEMRKISLFLPRLSVSISGERIYMFMRNEKEIKIRDLRNGDWYWLHKVIYELYAEKIGAFGLALYNAYAFYANSGKCFPSQKKIANKLSISERTIQRLNRKLEEQKLILIESGREKGEANTIYLLKIEGGYDKKSHPCDRESHQGATLCRTNNNNSNNNKLITPLSTERGEKSFPFGNQEINFLLFFLKEKMQIKKLDGPEKENRRYCWLCLKKFGKTETVCKLIEIAANSKFHSQNLTSFKYLYNHGVNIANEVRQKMNSVAIIE